MDQRRLSSNFKNCVRLAKKAAYGDAVALLNSRYTIKGNSSQPQATPVGAVLTKDLIYEILLRLPVASLLRFRCVSKQWNDTIKDAKFATQHRLLQQSGEKRCKGFYSPRAAGYFVAKLPTYHISRTNYEYFLVQIQPTARRKTPLTHLEFPFRKYFKDQHKIYDSHTWIRFSSCHGMLCILYWFLGGKKLNTYNLETSIVLWNPATRQRREIPLKSSLCPLVGLGYDPTICDYKAVIMVASGFDSGPVQIQVMSLKTNTWRAKELDHDSMLILTSIIDTKLRGEVPISIDGYIYWRIAKMQNNIGLFKFSLADERLTVVPTPTEWADKDVSSRLDQRNGSFYMYTSTKTTCAVDIWRMQQVKNGNGDWIRTYHFTPLQMQQISTPRIETSPVGFTTHEDLIFWNESNND